MSKLEFPPIFSLKGITHLSVAFIRPKKIFIFFHFIWNSASITICNFITLIFKFKFWNFNPKTCIFLTQMFYLFNQMLFRIFIYKNLKTKANNNMWPLNREFCQWNNCCLIYNWPVIYFCSKLFYRKNLPPWNAHIYVILFDCIFFLFNDMFLYSIFGCS